ncbi:MAG: trigger factor [Pirellulales bacterium]
MSNQEDAVASEAGAETEAQKLDLQVKIDKKSACERHITVEIGRDSIDRYFENALKELMPKAAVPGFRTGRAPRKLVETRFKKDVTEQVKGSLLMDSLSQVSSDNQLSPISEPDFDPLAVQIPDEGAMKFEFDIEVRPEFDLPDWKGLAIERPVRDFTDADVDTQLKNLLSNQGSLAPKDGAVAAGDYVSLKITAKSGDEVVSESTQDSVCVRKTLSFYDATLEGFDKLIIGAKAGDKKSAEVEISENAPNEAFRGKKVSVEFEVLEVKQIELPEMTPEFLRGLGDFDDESQLRDTVRKALERRLKYHQQQQARKQILSALTVAADWDLPPELLKRQASREFDRSVLELRRSGFSETEIRAHANQLMQSSRESTSKSLKEHFVLERIAENEKIDATSEDYEDEIALIAEQTGESIRRARAQIEKRGLMDTLHNQIIERKAIDQILAVAKFKDAPYALEVPTTEAVDAALAGGAAKSDIPEVAASGEAS